MKAFLPLFLILIAVKLTNAQNVVTGAVKDIKGHPIPGVFVGDMLRANAVFTDSLGNFSITAGTRSPLLFKASAFKDKTITADKLHSGLQVIMQASPVTGSHPASPIYISANPDDNTQQSLPDNIAAEPENTINEPKVSEYLFDTFVRGYAVNTFGRILYTPGYLFNYDKVQGRLVLTKDNKTIIGISKDITASFVLYSSTGERFDFEKVPSIDRSHYVQVLASGPKYKIYKDIKTRFAEPNTMARRGGEFVDKVDYFVLDTRNKQLSKLQLKEKSILDIFAKDADKTATLSPESVKIINDAYLTKLGALVNNY